MSESSPCRHGYRCSRCRKWWCADDEISFCVECVYEEEDGVCFKCLGLQYREALGDGFWYNRVCKDCWHRLRKDGIRRGCKCSVCGKQRREGYRNHITKEYRCKRCALIPKNIVVPSPTLPVQEDTTTPLK